MEDRETVESDEEKEGFGGLLPDVTELTVNLNNSSLGGGWLETASPTFTEARLPFLFGGKCG